MSFQIKVNVPRVTAEQIAQIEATVPGISSVVAFMTIENEKQAQDAAIKIGDKQVGYYEYVHRVEWTTETETGWEVTLLCMDD